ncbi:hypothetical protein AJ79_05857 [Helicocarpus griseus UAMH5409]|uniref:protein-ribulosamine 3-kinase n=1 Tax=Helicocarpus griseus UAMH5409 TaxID=1447875 RepID=A0A2B7XJJ7_9EURO|nr:hypothetical protein AJ79_05857 [Helicocarpus griseus UAMH5409]
MYLAQTVSILTRVSLEVSPFCNTVSAHADYGQELPQDCQIVSMKPHGKSFFANTSRIDVKLPNGTPQSFFIKVLSSEVGRNMVHGEFESMKAIYTIIPDFVPKPIAWGTYNSNPDMHFLLCEFREMSPDEMPSASEFGPRLARGPP